MINNEHLPADGGVSRKAGQVLSSVHPRSKLRGILAQNKLISQINRGTIFLRKINTSLSKETRIKLAYVLGSVISGRAKTDSDFDLAIVVDNADKIGYKYVYSLISDIDFPKDLDLSVVDKNSSPLFLFQIISTGKCIYQRSEEEKISFESYSLKNYYDNAHLRKIYYSYLKDKFPYAG